MVRFDFSVGRASSRAGRGAPKPSDGGSSVASPHQIQTSKSHLPSRAATAILRAQFMADVANKYPENVPGKYYVDNQCIDCDLCRETAPDNFKRNDDGGYSFVYKQAASPEEEARCKEAKEGCPVEAIGDNGA
jgi:ferredoxin